MKTRILHKNDYRLETLHKTDLVCLVKTLESCKNIICPNKHYKHYVQLNIKHLTLDKILNISKTNIQ